MLRRILCLSICLSILSFSLAQSSQAQQRPRPKVTPSQAQNTPASGANPGRVLAEILGGVLTASLGAAFGIAVGASTDCNDSDEEGVVFLCPHVFALGTAGAVLAQPLGVYGAGELAGGNGSLGYTYLGELIGAAVSLPAGLLMIELGDGEGLLAVLGVGTYLIGPLVGGIIGYENSQSAPRAGHKPSRAATGFGMHASVAPSLDGQGGNLVISGTF